MYINRQRERESFYYYTDLNCNDNIANCHFPLVHRFKLKSGSANSGVTFNVVKYTDTTP